jgi:hypothetical protein
MKRREFIRGLLATTLLLRFATTPAHAFDFEYMETEKAYNSTIKDAIEKEAVAAKLALKLKAESLGMSVRPFDLQKLNALLRNKAYLYASCLDRAIKARTNDAKIDVKSYGTACVKAGMKIADQIDREAWSEWGLDISKNSTFDSRGCRGEALIFFDKSSYVYDFLLDERERPNDFLSYEVIDYYKFKKCILDRYSYLR